MDDNTFWVKIWAMIVVLAIVIVVSVAAYSIVDRVGPLRPIVTQSTQYQAK